MPADREAGERASRELLAAPGRTDRAIAEAARCDPSTVSCWRRRLQEEGKIQPRPVPVPRAGWPPAFRERHIRPLAHTAPLPPVPDLSAGLCIGHPHREWWTSGGPDEREQAISVCWRCPARAACAEWSLSLPIADKTIYGAMTTSERLRRKRERARQSVAAAG